MQPLQARLPLKDPRPLRPPGGIKVESRPNTHALDALDDELARQVQPAAPGKLAPESALPGEPLCNDDRILARVALLERLLRTQEAELKRKDATIRQLQEEAQASARENQDMHRFLADYGLKWVGGRGSTPRADSTSGGKGLSGAASGSSLGRKSGSTSPRPSSAARAGPPPAASAGRRPQRQAAGQPAVGSPQAPDMERVRRAVAELNAIADGATQEVTRRRDGSHGFGAAASISLTFWADGLQLDGGEARGYGSSSCVAFLRDLLDGYFPYELRHSYPDGVLFLLEDRTRALSTRREAAQHSWGEGRRLRSAGGNAGGRGGGRAGGGEGGVAATAGARLVDIAGDWRPLDGVADCAAPAGGLGGGQGSGGEAAPSAPSPDLVDSVAAGGGASGDRCRLQIKGAAGGVALVTELPAASTVGELRALLLARGVVKPGQRFELRTAFPARLLSDPSASLAGAGLVPSATLCIAALATRNC